jgi:hypothetical protein
MCYAPRWPRDVRRVLISTASVLELRLRNQLAASMFLSSCVDRCLATDSLCSKSSTKCLPEKNTRKPETREAWEAAVRPITQDNLICSYCNKLKWNERENDKQEQSSSHPLGVLFEAGSITEFSAETETNDFSPPDENRTRLLQYEARECQKLNHNGGL